ncbi:MAG: AAA family ATPase [Chitinophagaceae bacterium]|nr:AAA family ATPase [Chitinophagaceae bacterium]
MEKLVGRQTEQERLREARDSSSAELIAIYGRRRIGKTFLVRQSYQDSLVFELIGVHNASMKEQLQNFSYALRDAMKSAVDLAIPSTWVIAFDQLKRFLEPIVTQQKTVIFFDEFPWIHTQKSNFLKSFDHFWNSWASRYPNLTVVICGSAASWMIQHVVNTKGGLHNRVTLQMKLMPFSLNETQEYLKSRAVKLDHYDTLQLYMAVGGVPHYLKSVLPKHSATQAIDQLFFTDNAPLRSEFANLYKALFDNPDHHEAVVRALAKVSKGLTRNELIDATSLSTGGTATKVLNELEESGFITSYLPFRKDLKDAVYKLTDEYSLFYLKFVERNRIKGAGTWISLGSSASWRSWSGYAFESICFKHIEQIKKALGPVAHATASVWRYVPVKGSPDSGAQIDLLLDRSDRTVDICEIKFLNEELTITKKYAEELRKKVEVFERRTSPGGNVHLVMVTTYGTVKNEYYRELVQAEIKMADLFKRE